MYKLTIIQSYFISLLAVYSFWLISCNFDKTPLSSTTSFSYTIPQQTDDGWETASMHSVGINYHPINELLNHLNSLENHRIHSLVIIKDGKLVFEKYFPGEKFNQAQYTGETGFDMHDTHNLCSATKSFTSALVGIAIELGYIQSVDQAVFDFFPEYAYILNSTPEKANITIEHLLTMTSGIQWDDETYPYFDPRNDLYQMFHSSQPMRYILLKPLSEPPGTYFAYRNCNTNILGEIVHKSSEQRLDDFSRIHLFNKLDISNFEWQMITSQIVFSSGDLRLSPRDMAKFGYLYLNGGNWKGNHIISQDWIDRSVQKHNSLQNPWDDLDGYGYQWWLWEDINGRDVNAYAASGWGGQWIIVLPDYNTVFVTTAGNYYTDVEIPAYLMLADYILPALSQ